MTLTDAEVRVLQVMVYADSEDHAAHLLGLSRSTVHVHLQNARRKLGVPTTRQAVSEWMRLGAKS